MGRKEEDVIFRECLDSGDVHLRLRLVGVEGRQVVGGVGEGFGWILPFCVSPTVICSLLPHIVLLLAAHYVCAQAFSILAKICILLFFSFLYVKANLARCWPPASCNSQYDSKRTMIINRVVYVHVHALYMVGIKRTILVGNKNDLIVIAYLTFMRKYDAG